MENEWQPLSVREGWVEPFELHDTVPAHLASHLNGVVQNVVESLDRVLDVLFLKLEIPMRTSNTTTWHIANAILSDSELTLNFLDFVARTFTLDKWRVNSDQIDEINGILRLGHSAWTIDPQAGALVRRVSEHMSDVKQEAISRNDPATTHLNQAWKCAFGTDPNPSEAWAQSTKALESALAPIVLPKDRRPGYGKIVDALRVKPDKWDFAMPGSGSEERVKRLISLLELVPYASDRHGGADKVEPIPQEVAESVVIITTTILQLVRTNSFWRK